MMVLLSGCVTRLYVNFGNATKGNVTVKSARTGEEIEVSPGRSKKFLHDSGELFVKTQDQKTYKFDDVETLSVPQLYRGGWNALPGPGRVILNLQLQTNMQLYALLPGKKEVDGKVVQPNGYPKIGTEVNEHEATH